MKTICQKVTFKLKKNKSQTQHAILLNQMYSSNMRQLYQLTNNQNQLPKHKLIPHLFNQLNKLQQNMIQQLSLYQPYHNQQLQRFLTTNHIPNAYSLLSLYEDKENQCENIKQKLTQTRQTQIKKSNLTDKKQQILKLKKHLEEQKIKKSTVLNKIEKIKEQLDIETKDLIQNKIDNFDQQLLFRKFEKDNQSLSNINQIAY